MKSYELTAKGKKIDEAELKGQAALIFPELKKPATVGEITERVGKKLETRQSPQLVVKHYVGVWKRDGLVRFAKKGSSK